MYVFYALSALPLWLTALLTLGITTLVAASAPLLLRRTVGFERLVLNNEIAGFQYSTLGTSYAVLLALAVVAVWDDYREAQRVVEREASAWMNLYRLAEAVPEPGRTAAHDALRVYAHALVDDEWPAMARGAESPEAAAAMHGVRRALLSLDINDARTATIYDHLLDRMIELTEGRRSRLDMSHGSLPPLIDTVLVVGAVLTISFTLFFAGKDVWMQACMTGMLCLMVMLVLFASIELNYPFAGGINIPPTAMESMLAQVPPP